VAGYCAHGVVRNTGGSCTTDPRRVRQKRIEAAIASLITMLDALSSNPTRSDIHHPGQYRFLRSGGAQSIGSSRHVGWGRDSRRKSRGTRDI
jgi:hypothetical protein